MDEEQKKKMVAKPPKTPKYSEGPTLERMFQDGGIVWEVADQDKDGNPLSMRARAVESLVIDWYFNKGAIDEQLRQAGYRFAVLYFCAGKVPRINVMWRERIQKSMQATDYDRWINNYSWAQRELHKALDILTPAESDVMKDVAGLNQRAGAPHRVRALKSGLRALAVHFDIPHNVAN